MMDGPDSGQSIPYWRLSGFYFFYFALLGSWLPYWSLYLEHLGYGASAIGLLAAVVMLTKVLAPSLWSWVATLTGRRMAVIRWGAGLATLSFSAVFYRTDWLWLLWVVAAYSFFWNAVLAQFEVVTLAHLGRRFARYSQIRVWGSVGFVLAVVGLGWLIDWTHIEYLPFYLLTLLLGILLSSLSVTEKADTRSPEHKVQDGGSLLPLLRRPEILAFFLSCFLLQVTHGPYYTFFSLYLEDAGYSTRWIGMLWSLGVIAEIGLFLVMHHFMRWFSLRQLLLISLGAAVLRWGLTAEYADVWPVLVVAQLLHAATFGSYHAVAVEFIRRRFGTHQGQGMALYSGLSFGAGGAVGALLAGAFWSQYPQGTFWGAAVIAFLATSIAWFAMPDKAMRDLNALES